MVIAWGVATLAIAGCPPAGQTPPQFAGIYDVIPGQAKVSIGWWVGGQQQQTTTQQPAQQGGGGAGQLEPVDPNDFPDGPLRKLAEQFNAGLAKFNDDIQGEFPNQVEITHPQTWLARVTNTEDPNGWFEGLNGEQGFLALRGGFVPGVIAASSVTGLYDGVDTVSGEWSIGIAFVGAGGSVFATVVTPYDAVEVP
jgi:hypothetical protein